MFQENYCARRIARLDGAPLWKSATSHSREGMSTTTDVQDPEMQNAWPSNLRTPSHPRLRRGQTDHVPVSAPCLSIPGLVQSEVTKARLLGLGFRGHHTQLSTGVKYCVPESSSPSLNIVMCWVHSRSSARGPGWPAALEGLWKPGFDTALEASGFELELSRLRPSGPNRKSASPGCIFANRHRDSSRVSGH